MSLESDLKSLGFSDIEAEVYKTLVVYGFRTSGQIASYVNEDLSTINSCLNTLKEKGLLKVKALKSDDAAVYIPLAPQIALSANISNQLQNKLGDLSNNVKGLWTNAEDKINTSLQDYLKTNSNDLNEYLSSLEKVKEEKSNKLESFKTKETDAINSVSQKLRDEIKSDVIPPITQMAENFESISRNLNQTKTSMVNQINDATKSHKESVANAAKESISEINDYTNELGLAVTARVTISKQTMDSVKEPAESNLMNLQGSFDKKVGVLSSNYLSTIKNFNHDHITQSMKEFSQEEESVNKKLSDIKKKVDDALSKVQQSSQNAENEAVQATINVLKEISDSLKQNSLGLQTGFTSAVKTTQTKSVQTLSQLLDTTSKDLTQAEGNVIEGLKTGQTSLTKQLNDLSTNLSQNIKQDFATAIKDNNEFKGNLNSSLKSSVQSLSDKLMNLQEFIGTFLGDTQSSLGEKLNQLQENVNGELESIISATNQHTNDLLADSKNTLLEFNTTTKDDIIEFQNEFKTILEQIRDALSDKIKQSQDQFNSDIESSVNRYSSATQEIVTRQEEQIKEIQSYAETLLKEATEAKDNMLSEMRKAIHEARDSNLDSFKESSKNSYDKVERDITRLNDKNKSELDEFQVKFYNNIGGLKTSIPSRIEQLFTNHEDKLRNLSREFQSLKNKTLNDLQQILNFMEENPKAIAKKKEEQEAKIESHRRLLSDFTKFTRNFEPFLKTEMEDSEITREEVIAELNRTIQVESEKVENLVIQFSGELSKLSNNMSNDLKSVYEKFTDDFSSQSSEVISQSESIIKDELTVVFSDPIASIVRKANIAAKGTEGLEQENMILKSQKELTNKIDESVKQLEVDLKEGYIKTLDAINEQISSGEDKVSQLSKDHREKIKTSLDHQHKSITGFTNNVYEGIKGLQSGIVNHLNQTVTKTNDGVDDVVNSKKGEISEIISDGIKKLDTDINNQLSEVNSKFDQFNNSLGSIEKSSISKLTQTVNESKTHLEKNVTSTIEKLQAITGKAKSALSASQKSLSEDVGKTLIDIQKQVDNLIVEFDKKTSEINKDMQNKIKTIYKKSLTQVSDVITNGNSLKVSADELEKGIKGVKNRLNEALTNKIKQLTDEYSKFVQSHSTDVKANYAAEIEGLINYINQNYDDITLQLDDLQTEVNGAIENVLNTVEHHVNNSIEQIRGELVNSTQNVTNVLESSSDEATNKLGEIISALKDASNVYGNLIDERMSGHLDQLHIRFSEIVTEIQQELGKMTESERTKLSTANDNFTNSLTEHSKSGKADVIAEIDKIPTVVNETLAAAGKAISLLTTIMSGASEVDPKLIETTYVDSSKEAIQASLNGLLKRTKSKIDIVSPTISWIDPNQFSEFSRRKINIVTDPSAHTDKDTEIIKKIQDSGTPLTLRRFDSGRSQFRTGLNMILVSRDGEEAMIAKPLEEKDTYGVITNDESFVQQFSFLVGNFAAMPNW
jgi:sugar-specific transcriptional regulator TrmB